MKIRKTTVYLENMSRYFFQNKNCTGLHTENAFSTYFIFKIEADPVGDYRQCKKVGQPSVWWPLFSKRCCQNWVWYSLPRRNASLCAISAMLYPGGQPTCYQQVINFFHSFRNVYVLSSGITAILRKIGCHEQDCDCEVTVAIGGSMFEEHHLFKDRVKTMVAQLMGKECKIELKLQEGIILNVVASPAQLRWVPPPHAVEWGRAHLPPIRKIVLLHFLRDGFPNIIDSQFLVVCNSSGGFKGSLGSILEFL